MSSIVDVLVDASYLFGYRERKSKYPVRPEKWEAAHEAYAFISGTGLDMVIKFYDMALDADRLRSAFMDMWRK